MVRGEGKVISTVFIYALRNPLTDETRYVGKSKHPKQRYCEHLSKARTKKYENIHLGHWINKLDRQGLKPKLEILEECGSNEWKEREKYHIANYKNLVNISEGGNEPPSSTGRIVSIETRDKLSKHRKGIPREVWDKSPHPAIGKPSPCKGQKRSKEFCELMSKQKIENNGMRGKKRTSEQIRASYINIIKAVNLIDGCGNILKQYESASLAQKELGLYKGSVSRVCNGEYNHTKGYKFEFAPKNVAHVETSA